MLGDRPEPRVWWRFGSEPGCHPGGRRSRRNQHVSHGVGLLPRPMASAESIWCRSCKSIRGLMRIHGVKDERASFAAFYGESRDACLRAVIATTSDRSEAEELVAEAFTRAWARWPQVSRHPAPVAWVVRTALNARVSWWRRRRTEVPSPELQPRVGVADPDPPFDHRLLVALRGLPLRQREVVALRVLLDLDTETTAQVLGIAPSTVTVHLSRAIAALRGSDQTSQPPTVEATP